MGYENTEKLQDYITKEIKQNIDEHGIHNLLIVAGATPEGIGCVYDIAKNLGVSTFGIITAGKFWMILVIHIWYTLQVKMDVF
ncbi:hypothetical protein CBG25_09615 [Arsenophonus sp. ENCA]|uniref:hypothetical protein n=1 Tax=Arsenophonus sp. ENCA TaxID=1987579 RepID=UPI000BC5F126|nr:hypothetical protein [Arsenophonus sp. ENCA]PAV02649.1 hypothetical protein CBG25_09615 [Arsenophonus sp. ENCA]